MLATAQRLRRREEFTAAVRGGRRAGRGVLVVHLQLDPLQLGSSGSVATSADDLAPAGRPARAGFVVPRAVGGAVDRNRVRRRLRHLVRDRLARLPAGAVLVVRALPGAARRTYPQLGIDLDGALGAVLRPAITGAAR